MTHGFGASAESTDDLLNAGIAAAKAGERRGARALLGRVVKDDPGNAQAWFWLSGVVDGPAAKEHCLQQVLTVDSEHELARQALAQLRDERETSKASGRSQPDRSTRATASFSRATEPAASAGSSPLEGRTTRTGSPQSIEGPPITPVVPWKRGQYVLRNEFIPIAVLGLALLSLVMLGVEGLSTPLGLLRLSIGLPFVLFVPGYTLQSALFPRAGDLDGPERLALSFGLSVAIIPPLALILDWLPWGISLWPAITAEGLCIAACSAVAWWRRRRLPEEQRSQVMFEVNAKHWWRNQDRTNRLLFGLLATMLLIGAGSALAIIVLPKPGENFTEFYILGADGLADSYPRMAAADQPLVVTTGIVNREGATAEYRIEVRLGDQKIRTADPVILGDRETWEEPLSFTLPISGADQPVELLLYRDGGSEPYRTLKLWIDVEDKQKP